MTDTTATAEANKLAMLNAICRGLNAADPDAMPPHGRSYGTNEYTDSCANAIHAAVKDQFKAILSQAVITAMEAPEFADAMVKNLMPEILIELADDFDVIHDDPKTPDSQRPGLRRANRHLRQLRNEAKDAQ